MQVTLSADDLRPIIETIVAQLADRLAPMDDRLSVDEKEAARLLGIPKHSLGDSRRRGEIDGALIGKRIVYLRADLAAFLVRRKAAAKGETSINTERGKAA